MASSSDAVGWGGGHNNVLAAAFCPRHTCCHTQHGMVSDGGVGWGGVGRGGMGWGKTKTSRQLRSLAATTKKASSSDAVGWGGVGCGGGDNNVLAAAFLPLTHPRPHSTPFPPRHTCYHTQHGIGSDAWGGGGGGGWGGVVGGQ